MKRMNFIIAFVTTKNAVTTNHLHKNETSECPHLNTKDGDVIATVTKTGQRSTSAEENKT